jgi:FO synthase subunit 2
MTEISHLLSDVISGHRLTVDEATRLLNTRDRDVLRIAFAADEMRERRTGNVVSYVKNQNLHVTNICKNLCGFCGFGRSADDQGAFCNDKSTIQEKARLTLKHGVTEICLLSGVHPDLSIDS